MCRRHSRSSTFAGAAVSSNEIVYRAKRLRVLLFAGLSACLGVACYYYGCFVDARTGLAPGSGFFHLFDPHEHAGRFYIYSAIAGLLVICVSRHLVDPRVMTTDENGISVYTFYGKRRALWTDFATWRRRRVGGRTLITLKFARPAGEGWWHFPVTSITLPLLLLGVKEEVVLSDIALRVTLQQHRPSRGDPDRAEPPPAALRKPMSPGAAPSFGRRGVAR